MVGALELVELLLAAAPPPAASMSASIAAATCFLWASQRAWASAYCASQASRWAS